jgi:hypothetical protein
MTTSSSRREQRQQREADEHERAHPHVVEHVLGEGEIHAPHEHRGEAAASDRSRIGPLMKVESLLTARAAVRALTASKIRELYNEGLGNPNVLPFWVGEPDEPTPDFIRKAGSASIAGRRSVLHPQPRHPGAARSLAKYVTHCTAKPS